MMTRLFKIGLTSILFIGLKVTAQQNKVWTLQECVTYALENNITVKQGENTILSNEQDVKGAWGNFLPNVNGSLGTRVNLGSGFDQTTNQRVNNTVYSGSYNVGLNQTIFNGFRILNIYKQSKLNKEQNELELNRIKDDISLNVVNTYLNILFNIENLETAEAQVEFSKKQLEQVKELVEAGVQPRANIFDSQATLSRDEQSLTIAQNNFDLALLSLSQLLQIPYEGFNVEIIDVDTPSSTLLYDDIKPILNYALENRNEIKVAEKRIESAKLGTEISKSGYLPTLSFSYNYGSSASFLRPRTLFPFPNPETGVFDRVPETPLFRQFDENDGHSFNLSLNIPIFSRLQNKTAVARSKIQEDNNRLQLEQAKIDLESTIQQAFTNAKAGFKAYEAAKASLESQQLAFDNSKERYDIGALNSFELEQARIALINAEASLINAKYDFVFRNKILDFYLGKSLTD